MYKSTKKYGHEVGLSACFRQWKADSHCKYLHGYALAVKFVFAADELDGRNWVVDFGGLKSLKGFLEDQFDHKTLVAVDDPFYAEFQRLDELGLIQMRPVAATGCESFAQFIYEATEMWLSDAGYGDRVWLESVEVKEHGANSAIFTGERR